MFGPTVFKPPRPCRQFEPCCSYVSGQDSLELGAKYKIRISSTNRGCGTRKRSLISVSKKRTRTHSVVHCRQSMLFGICYTYYGFAIHRLVNSNSLVIGRCGTRNSVVFALFDATRDYMYVHACKLVSCNNSLDIYYRPKTSISQIIDRRRSRQKNS